MFKTTFNTAIAFATLFVGIGPALAEGGLVGDPVNGGKLFKKECAACHGDDGTGGRTGTSMRDSGRMNLLRNGQLYKLIKTGKGAKDPAEHRFTDKLAFLEIWDTVAKLRTMHLTIADFFPKSSRYVSKVYEIDNFGLERIQEATGDNLKDKKAAVFTFFDFEGEEGRLTYVPQDPIKLDHLKKDKKAGYLVFLPFVSGKYDGEIGVAMDKAGVITKLAVHQDSADAELLNKSLSRFEGMGKKGQTEKFKVGGGRSMAQLAEKVFPTYLRAMETVTMYDREERERTWADD